MQLGGLLERETTCLSESQPPTRTQHKNSPGSNKANSVPAILQFFCSCKIFPKHSKTKLPALYYYSHKSPLPIIMTSNNRATTFAVNYRAEFEQCLSQTEATKPCDWHFHFYSFGREDIALVQQVNCQRLRLWQPTYEDTSSVQNIREEVLVAFLALKNVEKLTINMVVDKSFLILSDLYHFFYRSTISQQLKSVNITLHGRFDHSLARGLKYGSNITALVFKFEGSKRVDYMYQYFQSASLKTIGFWNATAKDCIALMREKRDTELENIGMWDYSVQGSCLVSMYIAGALLRKPSICEGYGAFPVYVETALTQYLKHLFKKFDINFK